MAKRKLKAELEKENAELLTKAKAYDRYRRRVRGIFEQNYGLRRECRDLLEIQKNTVSMYIKSNNELRKEAALNKKRWYHFGS